MAGGELDGVGEQVPDDLLQAVRVAGDGARRRVQHGLHADALGLGRRPHRVQSRLHHGREVHRPHVQAQLAGDDARDVEDVGDELALGARVAVDGLDGAQGGGGVELARAEHVRPAHHGVEGRAQLVGQGGQELVLGPVRRLRVAQEALALLLPELAFRDVDGRAHVGHERPVGGVVGHAQVVHPPVLAVEAAQAVLELERAPPVHGAEVAAETALEVVGMDAVRPSVLALGRERLPGEREPVPVEVRPRAVGARRPQPDGRVVEQIGDAGREGVHWCFPPGYEAARSAARAGRNVQSPGRASSQRSQ